MPKIRDLGINVIPKTMRPPEIGGGGAELAACDGGTNAPPDEAEKRPPCDYTKKPHCEYSQPACVPSNEPFCIPSNAPFCVPSNAPLCENTCDATPECDRTAGNAGHAALSDDAIAQLRQQLRQQVSAELPN